MSARRRAEKDWSGERGRGVKEGEGRVRRFEKESGFETQGADHLPPSSTCREDR